MHSPAASSILPPEYIVTTHTAAEKALANIVYERYDLGEVKIPKILERAHQRRHRKFVIKTERGRYLLKTYKNDPAILDTLRFQHRLSAFLDEHGLPVAKIQPAFNGLKIIEVDDWALELQKFIPGNAMRVTGKNLMTSAEALGKFHKVCRDFPCPDRDARMWRFSQVPRDLFSSLYERARSKGNHAIVDEHCNNIALFLRESTNELDFEARDKFETGLIHGDWHSGNLIFQEDKLAAIIDLEFAGDGCYLEDLAYAISNLCVRTCIEEEKLKQRVDVLLRSYQQYRTLSPSEEKALYYAVGIKHVATVCYQSAQQDGLVSGYNAAQWMAILDTQTKWLTQRAYAIKKGW